MSVAEAKPKSKSKPKAGSAVKTAPSAPALQKHEKMEFVAEHVARIILARGLNGLSYAHVAKSSGVSRAWLYKYVGDTKEALIEFAVAHFGRIFSELDIPVACTGREDFITHSLDSFENIFTRVKRYPWILPMYFRYAGTQTVIGLAIKHLEGLYLAKVTREIEVYMKPQAMNPRVLAQMLMALNLGVVFEWQNSPKPELEYCASARKVLLGFLESVK